MERLGPHLALQNGAPAANTREIPRMTPRMTPHATDGTGARPASPGARPAGFWALLFHVHPADRRNFPIRRRGRHMKSAAPRYARFRADPRPGAAFRQVGDGVPDAREGGHGS